MMSARPGWTLWLAAAAVACSDEAAQPLSPARAACHADCAQQLRYCASLDVKACQGLCDYVVAQLPAGTCTAAQTALWQCEATALWTCATATDIVGELVDPAACATLTAARDAACPSAP
jgi:hypothetical protein